MLIVRSNKIFVYEEIKSRLNSGTALLPFSPEPSVFNYAVKNHKH
jgi:hypothetical protein